MEILVTVSTEMEFKKFIPFIKVDSVLREVSGIVTAERPDKDLEVCDYEKSKPFYQAWSDEFRKATDGASLGNLREMHGLQAAGKATGLEFNDSEKAIVMTFKVVDDDAWKKVEERVYTGFSQGGRKVGDMTRDPHFKNCMRYVARPTEVSLVDNPCLPDAHFAYVKADGQVELRKFLNVELPNDSRLAKAEETIAELQEKMEKMVGSAAGAAVAAAVAVAVAADPAVKTKNIAGKDLPASSFAHVGDAEKTETWKYPIHEAGYIRRALAETRPAGRLARMEARRNPDSPKSAIRAKVEAAARKCGIDIAAENDKMAAIRETVRKAARIYVNTNVSKISSTNLILLDSEMGKLNKGMWEVSRMACLVEDIACLLYSVVCEQEYELDADSKLPEMLRENVTSLTEALLEMVNEETRELLAHVHAKS